MNTKINLPVYKKIIYLYMLGDFRAQGILPKTVLGKIFLVISTLCYLIPAYLYLNKNYITYNPQHLDLLIPFIFVLVCSLYILNSLGVGALTNTSSTNEIRALGSFPILITDLLNIRMIMGVFRGYLFNLVFIPPVILAILSNQSLFDESLYCSLLSFLFFPLLPSLVGIFLNLKSKEPNLQIWVILLCIYIFSGFTFLPSINDIPYQFNGVISLLSYPIWAVLGKLDFLHTMLFICMWTILSLIMIIMIYWTQNKNIHKTARVTWNEVISSLIVRKSRKAKPLYFSIIMGRVSFWGLLAEFVVLVLISYIIVWSIQDIQNSFVRFLILSLTSVSAPILLLFPILRVSIGKIAEHKKLQYLPIPYHWHLLIPLWFSILIMIGILGLSVPLLSGLVDISILAYYSIFVTFGSISIGCFLIHLLFSSKKIIASLSLLLFINIKSFVLLIVSVFFNESILTLSVSALVDILYFWVYIKFLVYRKYLSYLEENE